MTGFDLSQFLRSPLLSELDRRFARLIAGEDGGKDSLAAAAAALASYQLRRGHIFLDLLREPAWDDPNEAPLPRWPDVEVWREALKVSSAVGAPEQARPLLLTGSGKLYLQRYWFYEKLLAEKLGERSAAEAKELPAAAGIRMDQLFGDAEEQKRAARNALLRPFSMISGGPGTGKTTTVLKILLLMLENQPDLSVQLAAPTGKAAARLQQSILEGLAKIDCAAAVRVRVEEQRASTIHRLLGPVPGSVFFRHNAQNPLAADLVVVDEASMVDLPLMAKLFEALPSACRVIMLGDKDQLASVEAGSVLSGIVDAAVMGPGQDDKAPLAGTVTLLNRNFRFGNDSAIFRVCNAVREGNGAEALELAQAGSNADVAWRRLPAAAQLKEKLRPEVVAGFGSFLQKASPEEALANLGRFQILTALRQGPFGKENINLLVEEILREEGLIVPGRRNYAGRPLMVTENDYAVRLFNGDVGVLLEDESGTLMAFFRSEEGEIRKISPLRLPFTEPAFAMTVHKAQGSEFDEVLFLLPARDTPILTRELLYTGISRARRKVGLWCEADLLQAAIARKVSRASGLREMLAGKF